jgi:hypothetical protein
MAALRDIWVTEESPSNILKNIKDNLSGRGANIIRRGTYTAVSSSVLYCAL